MIAFFLLVSLLLIYDVSIRSGVSIELNAPWAILSDSFIKAIGAYIIFVIYVPWNSFCENGARSVFYPFPFITHRKGRNPTLVFFDLSRETRIHRE